jgi:hypothetical protein
MDESWAPDSWCDCRRHSTPSGFHPFPLCDTPHPDRERRGNVPLSLIAAGFVETPLSASLLGDEFEKRREELRATLPIGRVVGPADVAALAVHIMSNTALTGATYDIDGGQQLVS